MVLKSIFILFILIPSHSFATLDIRIGGELGVGIGDNNSSIPKKDDEEIQSFSFTGYNFDIVMSDYWLVLGARAEESSAQTGTFFYFDQNSNQYTKYGIKSKSRTFSGMV